MSTLTVSQLNTQVKSLLESHFSRVFVQGELSNLTLHTSGHAYFSLKDENGSVKCVLFKGNASKLKFKLEAGLLVIVEAALSVYVPRGEYQLNCFTVEPAGAGALALAFEQLKKKLSAKGYFDDDRKKKLPKYPRRVALVTSKTGAALQDMLRVATNRYPLVKFTLFNSLVQGEAAAANIAANIRQADSTGCFDIIVAGRGGGSIEDLWPFNEEIVADAIYECRTPIVSAVGHEIDWLISDFVADLRAPTPSACMELILPDINELRMNVDSAIEQFYMQKNRILSQKSEQLGGFVSLFRQNSISAKIGFFQKESEVVKERLNGLFKTIIQRNKALLPQLKESFAMRKQMVFASKKSSLESLMTAYAANDPKNRVTDEFAMIVVGGKKTKLQNIAAGEEFSLQNSEVELLARAISQRKL